MSAVKWLDKYFEETLLIIFLVIITFLTGLQVFMRYVLNASLTWSEELNRYSQVWSGFLCVGYCIKKSCDIKIDMFTLMLPKIVRKILNLAISLISIVLFAIFTKAAWGIIEKILVSGQTSAALKLPMQYLYGAPLVGFGLGFLRLIQSIIRQFRPGTENSKEVPV
ncbi:TRAP transporter small permease [Treponema primitia]|uniref:TRAP transporter small permease n=1 Tax=Treponema primitia TaxID=88058 RepID=UPI000255573A|nr:TRAP transporter small permease [Treponema primitia]